MIVQVDPLSLEGQTQQHDTRPHGIEKEKFKANQRNSGSLFDNDPSVSYQDQQHAPVSNSTTVTNAAENSLVPHHQNKDMTSVITVCGPDATISHEHPQAQHAPLDGVKFNHLSNCPDGSSSDGCLTPTSSILACSYPNILSTATDYVASEGKFSLSCNSPSYKASSVLILQLNTRPISSGDIFNASLVIDGSLTKLEPLWVSAVRRVIKCLKKDVLTHEQCQALLKLHAQMFTEYFDIFFISRHQAAGPRVQTLFSERSIFSRLMETGIMNVVGFLYTVSRSIKEDQSEYVLTLFRHTVDTITDLLEKSDAPKGHLLSCLRLLSEYAPRSLGYWEYEAENESLYYWGNTALGTRSTNSEISQIYSFLAGIENLPTLQHMFYFAKALVLSKPSIEIDQMLKTFCLALDTSLSEAFSVNAVLHSVLAIVHSGRHIDKLDETVHNFLGLLGKKHAYLPDSGLINIILTCFIYYDNNSKVCEFFILIYKHCLYKGDLEALSFIHATLAFVWYLIRDRRQYILDLKNEFPWAETSVFLNHLLISFTPKDRHENEFAIRPLPEDSALQDLPWGDYCHPHGQGIEHVSAAEERKSRIYWLAYNISTIMENLTFDLSSGKFSIPENLDTPTPEVQFDNNQWQELPTVLECLSKEEEKAILDRAINYLRFDPRASLQRDCWNFRKFLTKIPHPYEDNILKAARELCEDHQLGTELLPVVYEWVDYLGLECYWKAELKRLEWQSYLSRHSSLMQEQREKGLTKELQETSALETITIFALEFQGRNDLDPKVISVLRQWLRESLPLLLPDKGVAIVEALAKARDSFHSLLHRLEQAEDANLVMGDIAAVQMAGKCLGDYHASANISPARIAEPIVDLRVQLAAKKFPNYNKRAIACLFVAQELSLQSISQVDDHILHRCYARAGRNILTLLGASPIYEGNDRWLYYGRALLHASKQMQSWGKYWTAMWNDSMSMYSILRTAVACFDRWADLNKHSCPPLKNLLLETVLRPESSGHGFRILVNTIFEETERRWQHVKREQWEGLRNPSQSKDMPEPNLEQTSMVAERSCW